ncbi:hypothetical protein [Spiroplasma endosymbiont of Crioceris asparagi]|uniref:hypothetical protein n=1 Tax=Spiroplasma endosymbiont of Crioceris asparagi TaxID=3066286 RepID=UPI0030CFD097
MWKLYRGFIFSTITLFYFLTMFLISWSIYLEYAVKFHSGDYQIAFPNKPMGVSKNKNDYIDSFFGDKFDQYANYLNTKKPKETQKLDLYNAKFMGDIENFKNVINDSFSLNLWEQDTDSCQFVIKLKSSDFKKISLSLEMANTFSNLSKYGFQVHYGWAQYSYSYDDTYFPPNGIWIPDIITENKIINNHLKKDFVYIADISLSTTDAQKTKAFIKENGTKFTLNLITKIDIGNKQSYQQINKIKVNLKENDFSDIADKNNGINFLNNRFQNVNWLARKDPDSPINNPNKNDLNDEVKYVDYSWNHCLNNYFKDRTKINNQRYFSAYYMNNCAIPNPKDPSSDETKYLTWNYDQNDPPLVSWHMNEKNELYIPKNQEVAFFNNIKYAIKAGFNKIFLRGLDQIKWWSHKKNGKWIIPEGMKTWIYLDKQKRWISKNLGLINDGKKDRFHHTNAYYNKWAINWFLENKAKYLDTDKDNKDVTYYFYHDESIQKNMDEFVKLFDSLKYPAQPNILKSDTSFKNVKIAYANLFREININDKLLDDIDLIYIHNSNLEAEINSPIFKKFVNNRINKNLRTSQYSLGGSGYYGPGTEQSGNYLFALRCQQVNNFGYMHYCFADWTGNSDWNLVVNSTDAPGELTFAYPYLNDDNKWVMGDSRRYQAICDSYRLVLKMEKLKEKSQTKFASCQENINKIYQNYLKPNVDKFNFKYKNFDRKFKAVNNDSKFMSWFFNKFNSNNDYDSGYKIKFAYNIINKEW